MLADLSSKLEQEIEKGKQVVASKTQLNELVQKI
jgi:hypothetical protein